MLCFQVRETVTRGIQICTDPVPHVPMWGLPIVPIIDPRTAEDIIGSGLDADFWLAHATPVQTKEGLLLRRLGEYQDRSKKALVRIETAPGVGGKIRLKANVHEEVRLRDRVTWKWDRPFPPLGVHLFSNGADEGELHRRLTEGVETLDVLVSMMPGSSIRIERTGDLRDQDGNRALPNMSLYWNQEGTQLTMTPSRVRRGMRMDYSAPATFA